MKITPANEIAAQYSPGPQSRRISVEDKLPASRWQFVQMVCEHYTTPEEIERYSHWQPKRGRYFCDKCGTWKDRKPRPKFAPIPEEPLF
jgi:transposase-like protein